MKKLCAAISYFSLLFFSQNSFAGKEVVARVNNKIITIFEVEDRYKFVIYASKIQAASDVERKMLRMQIVDKMIDEELIRQQAASLSISNSNEELVNALEIVALQRKENPQQFKANLVKNNISFNNYLQQLETEILWSKIMSQVVRSGVKVNDREVSEFLEQYKAEIDVRKFLLAEILINNKENSLQFASKLVDELREGADFNNIVKQFSQSVSVENNGEIGWVSKMEVNQKIYDVISKLKKGEYSQPLKLEDGYHIFKLLDAKVENNVSPQDFNAAQNAIFSAKLQNSAKGYLMEMRKKAFIEKNY